MTHSKRLNNLNDIDKAYISDYDFFLHNYDKAHPEKSASQQAEINKHQLIAAKRDGSSNKDDK